MRNPWTGALRAIWLNSIAGSVAVPASQRYRLLRGERRSIGSSRIENDVYFFGSGPLTIGTGGYINRRTVINHSGGVTIGDRVFLGPEVMILTASHDIGPETQRAGTNTTAPVHIGDGAWLGARVTVLPGVTIGAGAVVGTGSVVTKDLPPNGKYVGSPARLVSDLPATPALTRVR
jgi:acetyltransferase-like isoleucine patch superfamily enzyme